MVQNQALQPALQDSQPAGLLVLIEGVLDLCQLLFEAFGPDSKVLDIQGLALLSRAYLAQGGNPGGIEEPGRYPEELQVGALQVLRGSPGPDFGKEFPLHPPIEIGVGIEGRVARDSSLIGKDLAFGHGSILSSVERASHQAHVSISGRN